MPTKAAKCWLLEPLPLQESCILHKMQESCILIPLIIVQPNRSNMSNTHLIFCSKAAKLQNINNWTPLLYYHTIPNLARKHFFEPRCRFVTTQLNFIDSTCGFFVTQMLFRLRILDSANEYVGWCLIWWGYSSSVERLIFYCCDSETRSSHMACDVTLLQKTTIVTKKLVECS